MTGGERKRERRREEEWSVAERRGEEACSERHSHQTNAFCGIQQVCCLDRRLDRSADSEREKQNHQHTAALFHPK